MDFNTKFLAHWLLEIVVLGIVSMIGICLFFVGRAKAGMKLPEFEHLVAASLVGLPFGVLFKAGIDVLGGVGAIIWLLVMQLAACISAHMLEQYLSRERTGSKASPSLSAQSPSGKKRRKKKRERK